MIKNFHRKIIISLLIAVLVSALLAVYADFENLAGAFSRFRWGYLLLLLSLSFLNYTFRFFRWEFYLRRLGIRISFAKSFTIFMSGLTMSVTPGKVGETLKSYLLKLTDDVKISVSAPIVLAERLTDFLALVVLAIYGSFFFRYGEGVILSIAGLIIAGTFALGKKEIFYFLFERTKKFFGRGLSEKIGTAYESIQTLVNFKTLIPAVAASILSWFFECVGFYIVLKVYSLDLTINLATFIYSFATIAGAVSMLPGGLGLTEGSITSLLVLNSVPKDTAVASTLIIRFSTLWFAVALGLAFLYIFQKVYLKGEDD